MPTMLVYNFSSFSLSSFLWIGTIFAVFHSWGIEAWCKDIWKTKSIAGHSSVVHNLSSLDGIFSGPFALCSLMKDNNFWNPDILILMDIWDYQELVHLVHWGLGTLTLTVHLIPRPCIWCQNVCVHHWFLALFIYWAAFDSDESPYLFISITCVIYKFFYIFITGISTLSLAEF